MIAGLWLRRIIIRFLREPDTKAGLNSYYRFIKVRSFYLVGNVQKMQFNKMVLLFIESVCEIDLNRSNQLLTVVIINNTLSENLVEKVLFLKVLKILFGT